MSHDKIFRLACQPQNYLWGKIGFDSLVAKYLPEAGEPGSKADPKAPHAELWMGTHKNGPARLRSDTSVTLSEHLKKHPELLGSLPKDRFPAPADDPTSAHVPFLFKILTCKQALPLQIHPDKKLAEKLNKENPEQFNDQNHKPEIAVALTPFQGFVGFRPLKAIERSLNSIPELRDALSSPSLSAFLSSPSSDTLRTLFGYLLSLHADVIRRPVETLVERVKNEGRKKALAEEDGDKLAEVLQKGIEYYGTDPG